MTGVIAPTLIRATVLPLTQKSKKNERHCEPAGRGNLDQVVATQNEATQQRIHRSPGA